MVCVCVPVRTCVPLCSYQRVNWLEKALHHQTQAHEEAKNALELIKVGVEGLLVGDFPCGCCGA